MYFFKDNCYYDIIVIYSMFLSEYESSLMKKETTT